MSYLIVMDFECNDVTGTYISTVIIDRRGNRYICYYADFDNVFSILTFKNLHYIPATLKTLLSEESGIVPRVKFLRKEIWAKENALPL